MKTKCILRAGREKMKRISFPPPPPSLLYAAFVIYTCNGIITSPTV